MGYQDDDLQALPELARAALAAEGDDAVRAQVRQVFVVFAEELYHLKLSHSLGWADPVARFLLVWERLLEESAIRSLEGDKEAEQEQEAESQVPAAQDAADGEQAADDTTAGEERTENGNPAGAGAEGQASGTEAHTSETVNGTRLNAEPVNAGQISGEQVNDQAGSGAASAVTEPTAPGGAPATAAGKDQALSAGDDKPGGDKVLTVFGSGTGDVLARVYTCWDDAVRHGALGDAADYVPRGDDAGPPAATWNLMHLTLLRLPESEARRWRQDLAKAAGVAEEQGPGLVPACEPLGSAGIALHPAELYAADLRRPGAGRRIHPALAGLRPPPRQDYAWLVAAASDLLHLGEHDRALGLNMPAIKMEDGLQPPDPETWTKYHENLVGRVKPLAERSEADELVRTLVRLDEMLAGLLPVPLPQRYSWWQKRREMLLLRLREHVRNLGGRVEEVGSLHSAAEAVTDRNVSVPAPPGKKAGDVLWTLAVPYRVPSGRGGLHRGRIIYAGQPASRGTPRTEQ